MITQLVEYLHRVRSSFWFVPGIMSVAAIALAMATIASDETATSWLERAGLTFTGGAEAASAVLQTIASSMITIAGVIFSMTLVALTLTTSQYGPRLLRTFMRDTTTQVVLGTFVATFLYCLVVLRSIRRAEEATFVPHLAVTFGVLLAVVSVGFLIYFIHHIALSIQADEVVVRVAHELHGAIDRLFPESAGAAAAELRAVPDEAELPEAFEREARTVRAAGDGYIQSIDSESVIALAREEDVLIRVELGPGSYVMSDCPLARAWPASRVSDRLEDGIRGAFILGNQRTTEHDIDFAVQQLVEIAVRALSPSLSDPFTAVRCVDRLGSALSRVAQRNMPPSFRYDEEGRLRLVAPVVTFPSIADAAFDQIRRHSGTSAAVTLSLLDTIAVVAEFASLPEDRAALRRQADMIARGAREGLSEAEDRREVEQRLGRVHTM